MEPTDKRIEEEIARLIELKESVRRRSAFGDDHHSAIDAQIATMREFLKTTGSQRMREVQVEYFVEENRDWADNVADAANEALDWISGNHDAALYGGDSPAASWEELAS